MTGDNPEETAEELLGFRGRIRVLKVISKSGELNITEIRNRTRLNYKTVERHLKKLTEMGLLKEKRYGNTRIFKTLFRKISISFIQNKGIQTDINMHT